VVKKKRENMPEVASKRSKVYGLLTAVYREEPNPALLRQFKDARFRAALSSLGVDLEDKFFSLSEEELIEDLAVEYARLFVGPGKHISPHESVHLKNEEGGGLLWGEATAKVKKFIESAGFEYKSDYCEIPDHIAVELEFMQGVTERECRAWNQKDNDGVFSCLETEKKFIDEHLVRWVPLFCEEIISYAELPFYREMGKLTKRFIEFEKEEIGKYIDDLARSRGEGPSNPG
jgi:TorA maturation chaperone TorD